MLTVWRPFGDLFRDDSFGRDWDDLFRAAAPPARAFNPAVDVLNTENAYVLKAELPGVNAEEVDIQVHDNVLTLRGERKFEDKSEAEGYHRVERRYGSFARSFTLPEGVDDDAIEAALENGVLTIRVPKPAARQPHKIAVSSGGLVDKAKKLFTKPKNGSEEAAQPAS
ncbi:MAG TPA: Hsp20/alpha crystallin family protein [Polyangiaceae bacterium]